MRWSTHPSQGLPALLCPGPGEAQWLVEGRLSVQSQGRRWTREASGWRVAAPPAQPPSPTFSRSGYIYGPTPQGRRALGLHRPGEALCAHPSGAYLTGEGLLTHGAAPGRTLRPLPTPLLPSHLRFSSNGHLVAGLNPDQQGALIDLTTLRELPHPPGLPVATGCWHTPSTGALRDLQGRRHSATDLALVEVSCASRDHLLAGPGGVLWDLRTAEALPHTKPVVHLGLTLATEGGFLTVDWQHHTGHHIRLNGSVHSPFKLPLEVEDTIATGHAQGASATLTSEEGRRFRIQGSVVQELPPAEPHHPPQGTLTVQGIRLPIEGATVVQGVAYAWWRGWLYAASPSSISLRLIS